MTCPHHRLLRWTEAYWKCLAGTIFWCFMQESIGWLSACLANPSTTRGIPIKNMVKTLKEDTGLETSWLHDGLWCVVCVSSCSSQVTWVNGAVSGSLLIEKLMPLRCELHLSAVTAKNIPRRPQRNDTECDHLSLILFKGLNTTASCDIINSGRYAKKSRRSSVPCSPNFSLTSSRCSSLTPPALSSIRRRGTEIRFVDSSTHHLNSSWEIIIVNSFHIAQNYSEVSKAFLESQERKTRTKITTNIERHTKCIQWKI